MRFQKLRPILAGFFLDLVDWLALGLAPFLGDLIDLLGIVYFAKVEGLDYKALLGGVEFIPAVDILPTFTALGLYASSKQRD